jgi:hypothetical protein
MLSHSDRQTLWQQSVGRHLTKLMGGDMSSPIAVSCVFEPEGVLCFYVENDGQRGECRLRSSVVSEPSESLSYPLPLPQLLSALKAALSASSPRPPKNDASFFDGVRGFLISPSDEPTRLTEREADLLQHLYAVSPTVVSRETLMHEVWGYASDTTTHTLETHIYRLRQKMAQSGNRATLETVEGGYRLIFNP